MSAPPAVPASIQLVAGDRQTTKAGSAFPEAVVVRVVDAAGSPARGAAVEFAVALGGGTVSPATASTDADGRASTRWSAGTVAGVASLTISSGTAAGSVLGTIVPAPPARIERLDPDSQRLGAASAVTLHVRVSDRFRNPTLGAGVTWKADEGAVQPLSARTNSAGVSAARWVVGEATGPQHVKANLASDSASLSYTAVVLPVISQIRPSRVLIGDTVKVYGHGLRAAMVRLAGAQIATLFSVDTVLAFAAPSPLPSCDTGFAALPLQLAAGAGSVDTSIQAGAPAAAPSSIGLHTVLPGVARGCRLQLGPGVYGIAVYRTAVPIAGTSSSMTPDSVRFGVELRPGAGELQAAAARVVNLPVLRRPLAEPTSPAPDVLRPAAARAADPCIRPPGAVGDTLRVSSLGPNGSRLFRIMATSQHLNWLFPADAADTLSARPRQRLAALASYAEINVHPFLLHAFGPLPDNDANGRLDVIIGDGAYYGFTDRYRDGGCRDGDFVNLGWVLDWGSRLPPDWDLEYEAEELVHEATHWVDLQTLKPTNEARVEGVARLAEVIYNYERDGVTPWGAHDDGRHNHLAGGCDLQQGRYVTYGSYGSSYVWGCAHLRYLADQRIWEGAAEVDVLHALLHRSSHGELLPIWQQLGGSGRSEAELQGELELMQYADGLIPGISPRIQNRTFNIYAPTYTLGHPGTPYFTAVADRPQQLDIWLSSPDGLVFELTVPPDGATATLADPPPNGGFAIVRRQ